MVRTLMPATYLWVVCLMIGCGGGSEPAKDKLYGITGRVVAVEPEKKSITLDHEDIPGLMKAMTMKLSVEDAKLLQGIAAGDKVRGRLRVQAGEYILTELRKE